MLPLSTQPKRVHGILIMAVSVVKFQAIPNKNLHLVADKFKFTQVHMVTHQALPILNEYLKLMDDPKKESIVSR